MRVNKNIPAFTLQEMVIVMIIFGSSRQVAIGPVAMDSLIVATGVSTLALAGSDSYIAIAILLALVVGAIQFLLGVFRLGFVVNFLLW